LYPPECGGCKRAGYRWCPACQDRIQALPDPVCEVCGLPGSHPGLCSACANLQPPFRALRSWVVFEEPIRSALHQLKYRRNLALGDALAKPLAEYARSLMWPIDVVGPVPLGKKRMRERGYNQVALVALPLAARTGWQYAPRGLHRVRETRSQVGLSAGERKENMQAAFHADRSRVQGHTVLLMDDVATTGATLSACAGALLEAGAEAVYALTLARALPHHGLTQV